MKMLNNDFGAQGDAGINSGVDSGKFSRTIKGGSSGGGHEAMKRPWF
jgi:hypothetical protein